MIKKYSFLAVLFVCAGFKIVVGTDDIPVLEGLEEKENLAAFDSAEGKMTQSVYETGKSCQYVVSSYAKALKNFGWLVHHRNQKSVEFLRGKEKLSITCRSRKQKDKKNDVYFSLTDATHGNS